MRATNETSKIPTKKEFQIQTYSKKAGFAGVIARRASMLREMDALLESLEKLDAPPKKYSFFLTRMTQQEKEKKRTEKLNALLSLLGEAEQSTDDKITAHKTVLSNLKNRVVATLQAKIRAKTDSDDIAEVQAPKKQKPAILSFRGK